VYVVVQHYFDYCTFVLYFEVKYYDASNYVILKFASVFCDCIWNLELFNFCEMHN
jgi:hypothetical protein